MSTSTSQATVSSSKQPSRAVVLATVTSSKRRCTRAAADAARTNASTGRKHGHTMPGSQHRLSCSADTTYAGCCYKPGSVVTTQCLQACSALKRALQLLPACLPWCIGMGRHTYTAFHTMLTDGCFPLQHAHSCRSCPTVTKWLIKGLLASLVVHYWCCEGRWWNSHSVNTE